MCLPVMSGLTASQWWVSDVLVIHSNEGYFGDDDRGSQFCFLSHFFSIEKKRCSNEITIEFIHSRKYYSSFYFRDIVR